MNNFTNHSEMVAALVKPGEDIIKSLTPLKAHLWHMASCVMGEVGELLEVIDKENSTDDLIEELGDIEFYLEGIRQPLHISRDSTLYYTGIETPICDIAVKAGELFDVIKKHVIYNKELDIQATVAALHNVEEYLMAIRDAAVVTYEETLQANLNKLNKRYAEKKYSDAQAQARADKTQEAVNNATA